MNLFLKLEFDWLHMKTQQAIRDANSLVDASDDEVSEVLKHLVAAQTEMKAAIAAIEVVKATKLQTRKAG